MNLKQILQLMMNNMSLIKIDVESESMSVGDEINFRFDYHSFYLIIPIMDQVAYIKQDEKYIEEFEKHIESFEKEFSINKTENKIIFEKFHNMIVSGVIYSFSRVDNQPIIKFDTDISKHRDNKINKILL